MFQENLKTLRKNKGITQEELAVRLTAYSSVVNNGKQFIQAAFDRRCIMIKLKKVGRLPVEKLVLSRKETADQLSVRQSVKHCIICLNIRGGQLVKYHDDVNIARFRCFTATVAALQSYKPYAVCKCFV